MKKMCVLLTLLPLLSVLSAQIHLTKLTLDPWHTTNNKGILGKLPIAFDERVWHLKFSSDGREILSVTDTIDSTAWPSGRPRTIWAPAGNNTLDRAIFSPDSSLFARSENGKRVLIHETSSGKVLHTFEGKTPRFGEVTWSPDGKKIAIGVGGDVVIHDLVLGSSPRSISPGGEEVVRVEWSPDGQWLAVGTENTFRIGPTFLINLNDDARKPVRIPGDEDMIFSFSPDSTRLAINGLTKKSGISCLWDIGNQKEIVRIRGTSYNDIKHSPDGRLLVAGGLNELRVFDALNLTDVTRRNADSINDHIYSLAFSPDGSMLAYGVENRIRVRDTRTWDEINPDDTLRAPVNALAFSADGKHLVTGGWNGDLVMWDWQKKAPVWKQLAASKQWHIQSLSIDPSSRWIGVVQNDYSSDKPPVRLIQYATGAIHRMIESNVGTRSVPLFTPSGDSAYIANADHDLMEFDCATGKILRRLPIRFLKECEGGKNGVIDELAYDLSKPEMIRWRAEGQAAGRFDLKSGETVDAFESRFSKFETDITPPRTHEFLAMGSHVRNLPSLNMVFFPQNGDRLSTIRHPSGLLYFFARDRTVSVCDLLSQSIITQIDVGPGDTHALAISPDGLHLVAGTTGGLRYVSLEGSPIAEGTTLETLWNLMGSENHWMAYQAAWAMGRQPDFINFLDKTLLRAEKPNEEWIAALKKQMADSSHEVRQTAARQWLDLGYDLDNQTLASLGEGAIKAKWPHSNTSVLPHTLLHYSNPIDIPRPVPQLTPLSTHRQAMRAVMLLKASRKDAATRLLERLANGYIKAPLTIACKRALQ